MSAGNKKLYDNYLQFLTNNILAPVVNYVNERDNSKKLTLAELLEGLKLPNNIKINTMPQCAGNVTPKIKQPAKRESTALESPVEGLCKYAYKRGKHKNKYCGKPVEPDEEYCKNCLKAFEKKNRTKATKTNPGVAPDEIKKNTGYDSSLSVEQNCDDNQMNVEVFDESRHLYKSVDNIIIYCGPDSEAFAAVGKLDPVTEEIVKLSAEDKELAKKQNMIILNDDEYETCKKTEDSENDEDGESEYDEDEDEDEDEESSYEESSEEMSNKTKLKSNVPPIPSLKK